MLLVLQELLLLVVLDLLDLLQLLELTLLLESQLLLLLLRQEVSLSIVAVGPDHVGARLRRRHAGRITVDGVPGVGGREAVVALGDVRVRPHLCRGVVQYLIWKKKGQQIIVDTLFFSYRRTKGRLILKLSDSFKKYIQHVL